MNRRPTRKEATYYGVMPADAVLQWQVHLHRDDREYQRDIKHREFLWQCPYTGSWTHATWRSVDGEIRGFGGAALYHSGGPRDCADATREDWVAFLHWSFPERKLEAFRADGWTVEIWTPPIEQLVLDLGFDSER